MWWKKQQQSNDIMCRKTLMRFRWLLTINIWHKHYYYMEYLPCHMLHIQICIYIHAYPEVRFCRIEIYYSSYFTQFRVLNPICLFIKAENGCCLHGEKFYMYLYLLVHMGDRPKLANPTIIMYIWCLVMN